MQVDFSATPYNDVGTGKHKQKRYFPHIVTDFDLKAAMRAGVGEVAGAGPAQGDRRVLPWSSKPSATRTATHA